MRACEGCRRRKIKCDAATTNTWPCSACIRLKLHCVPPTVNYDSENGQGFDGQGGQYEGGSGEDEYQDQISLQQQMAAQKGPHQVYPQQVQYTDNVGVYHPVSYGQPPPVQQPLQFHSIQGPGGVIDNHYPAQNVFPVAPLQQQQQQQQQHQQQNSASPESYGQEVYDQQALTDLLGDLRMTEAGTGMLDVLSNWVILMSRQHRISTKSSRTLFPRNPHLRIWTSTSRRFPQSHLAPI